MQHHSHSTSRACGGAECGADFRRRQTKTLTFLEPIDGDRQFAQTVGVYLRRGDVARQISEACCAQAGRGHGSATIPRGCKDRIDDWSKHIDKQLSAACDVRQLQSARTAVAKLTLASV